MTMAEFLATIERRAADAEREGATAPVANVYRLVLDELRAVNGTASAAGTMHDVAAEEQYLTPEQVAEMLALPKAYAYRHKRQLGGVKIGKYLRFPKSVVQRRLARFT